MEYRNYKISFLLHTNQLGGISKKQIDKELKEKFANNLDSSFIEEVEILEVIE